MHALAAQHRHIQPLRSPVQAWWAAHSPENNRNGEALLQWAILGYGVVYAPGFMVEDALRDGRLVQVLAAYPSPELSMCIMRPPGGLVPAKVRALTDFLVSRMGDCTEMRRDLPD